VGGGGAIATPYFRSPLSVGEGVAAQGDCKARR